MNEQRRRPRRGRGELRARPVVDEGREPSTRRARTRHARDDRREVAEVTHRLAFAAEEDPRDAAESHQRAHHGQPAHALADQEGEGEREERSGREEHRGDPARELPQRVVVRHEPADRAADPRERRGAPDPARGRRGEERLDEARQLGARRRPAAQPEHERHGECAQGSPGEPDEAARTDADLVEASAPEGHGRAHRDGREEREGDADGEAPSRDPSSFAPRAAGSTTTSSTPASTTPMNTSAPWSSRSPTIGTASSVAIGTLSSTTVAAVCTPQRVIAAKYKASATEKPRKPERNSQPHASPTGHRPPRTSVARKKLAAANLFLNRLAAAGETLPWDRSLENAIDAKAQLAAAESAARTGPVATAPEGSGIGGSAPERADPDPRSALRLGLLGGLGLDGDALARLLAGEQVLARTHTDLADAASAARGAACFELGLRHGSCSRRAPPSGERPKRVGRPPPVSRVRGGTPARLAIGPRPAAWAGRDRDRGLGRAGEPTRLPPWRAAASSSEISRAAARSSSSCSRSSGTTPPRTPSTPSGTWSTAGPTPWGASAWPAPWGPNRCSGTTTSTSSASAATRPAGQQAHPRGPRRRRGRRRPPRLAR